MKPTSVILIALVAAAVVAVIALKPARSGTPSVSETGGGSAPVTVAAPTTPSATGPATTAPATRPRLLSLGAGKCVPCKMMEPIREALRTEYAGALQVDFIDVWNDHAAGVSYGIRTIPTLIYFAPDGRELIRQEGFVAKEDILAQWKVLGYELKPVAIAPQP